MKTDIPDFLLEMSDQINTQENRCTADPIWQVRCKRWRVTAEGYSDVFHIFNHFDGDVVADSSHDSPINEQISSHIFNSCGNNEWVCSWSLAYGNGEESMSEQDLIDDFNESFDAKYNELPENVDLHWMEEYEDIVKTCLTEADANWFIKRKQHDYPKLYTYVESMCYCPQMIELRNWIKQLNASKARGEQNV